MKQPVVLRVYKNGKLEAVQQFNETQIVIGRDGDVQLKLADPSISALHAMIEDRDGRYFLSDLGSKEGTYKNKQKVLETDLSSGDEITVGEYRIQFFIGVPKAAPPPAPTPMSAGPKPQPPAQRPVTSSPKAVGFVPADPVAGAAVSRPGKSKKTFAPASPFKDAKEYIKPGKGTVVEVLVLWHERVLSTNHFYDQRGVTIGGGTDADVMVPVLSTQSSYQLLRIAGGVTICLTPQLTGEVIRDSDTTSFGDLARQGKMRAGASGSELELRQGEMVRVILQDNVSVIVRYKAETPKPVIAPLLDLTNSEVTGVILAGVIAAIFFLYMNLYAPASLLEDEARVEEPIRKAVVTFNPPQPAEPKEQEKEQKKVVEVKDQVKQIKSDVKSAEAKARKTPTQASVKKEGEPGKAGEVAPKKTKDKQKKLTSVRPGGAIKTGQKEGANMKSDRPDPTKAGMLGVFGSKGMQSKLDQAYSGNGELVGAADAANGAAGSNENRAGDTMGTKLKDTGAGGKGTQTIGIAGVGTNGRGTGTTGYGTGGLGSKGSVRVEVGGQDAEFSGSIDKEAIRRVILAHKAEIRFCYDQELQRHPDLAGKIAVHWQIDEQGRVHGASAPSSDNAMGSTAVANCIVNKLKTWQFPQAPPDMLADVKYPFVFEAQ